jgi:hypothetical protein
MTVKEYSALIDSDTRLAGEKVRKLRMALNTLNDEIKGMEKEQEAQIMQISVQKRLNNVICL